MNVFVRERPKSSVKIRKTFHEEVTSASFASVVAAALKAEFGGTPSSMKTVSQLTRSNERAVRNWFEGKHGPSGENLIVLMRHSDLVLKSILSLADRQDLVVAVGLASLRRQLVDAVAAIDGLPSNLE